MMDRAYISVIEWAPGETRDSAAAALVDALGVDLYTARLRAAPPPPVVVAFVEAPLASAVLARLKAAGISAASLTRSYLAALPAPVALKSLAPALGAAEPLYMAECWQGEPRGLRSADIFMIVRATLERTTTSISIEARSNYAAGALGVSGMAIPGALSPADSVRSTTRDTTQVIDLFLKDGSHLRINARRFSFGVLGATASFTTRENADALALRLAKEAPEACLDTGFSQFRPPPDLVRDMMTVSRNRTRQERDESTAFDFYSVWVHAIQRTLAGKA